MCTQHFSEKKEHRLSLSPFHEYEPTLIVSQQHCMKSIRCPVKIWATLFSGPETATAGESLASGNKMSSKGPTFSWSRRHVYLTKVGHSAVRC